MNTTEKTKHKNNFKKGDQIMIEEDHVSFETAKLLKEKGFDEPVMYHFTPDGTKRKFQQAFHRDDVAQPTLQMAMKWLREVHRIETHITLSELNADNSRKYMFDTFSSDVNKNFDSAQKEGFNSYEQACEAAVKYCLENLI